MTEATLQLFCPSRSPWGRREAPCSAPAPTLSSVKRIPNLHFWPGPLAGCLPAEALPPGVSNSTCLKPHSDCLLLTLPSFALLVHGTNSPSPSVFAPTAGQGPDSLHGTWGPLGARPTYLPSPTASLLHSSHTCVLNLGVFLSTRFSFFKLEYLFLCRQSDCTFSFSTSRHSSFEKPLKIATLPLPRRAPRPWRSHALCACHQHTLFTWHC